MQRTEQVTFYSDNGRQLVTLGKDTATVHAYTVNNAKDLAELATACQAAAEELWSREPAKDEATA